MNNSKDYENPFLIQKKNAINFKITGAFTNPRHWHEYIEIHYFFDTGAKIFCEDEIYDTNIGDLVIINSNQMHTNLGAGFFLFHIDPSALLGESIPDTVMFQNFIRNDETIKKIFSHILDEYTAQQENYRMVIKGYAFQLMAYLLRNYKKDAVESKNYFRTKNKAQLIEMITTYINKNYFAPISTSTVAEAFHLSTQYLCSFFKNQTGQSVVSYIIQYRMDRAAALLKNTNQSITEIASSVGYDDSNYFSRLFKQHMEMTPKDYRRQMRQSEENQ